MAVDASRARPASYSGKPVATADYDGGGIMVWVEDGWLSHLEICVRPKNDEAPPLRGIRYNGSDGARTRDLRRDRPAL
jgi:hypothetical protein